MHYIHRIRHRFILLVAGLLGIIPLVAVPVTSASSYTNDVVSCGLQAGVNLDISQLRLCASHSSSTANDEKTTAAAYPATQQTSGNYVALGDSVAAGLGLSSNDTQCGRSNQSYAYQVAAATGLNLQHIACSGATAGDLVTKQAIDGPNITAQLEQAFSDGTPQLITITAGANDAHWADFIRACYITDCSSTASTVVANTYLQALKVKLNYALSTINARSNGQPPQVLITGYYNPVSADCTGALAQVSAKELGWIGTETAKLNQVIAQAASAHSSFVRYVPISFTGHDICSSDPWIQGVSDAAPFHPTATGQDQIAQAIIKSYDAAN